MDERKLENRLREMVYANGNPLTLRDVKEAVRRRENLYRAAGDLSGLD